MSIGKYDNDEKIGEWKWYYENGKLKTIGNYDEEGGEIGEWKRYYKNGQLRVYTLYDSDGYAQGEWKWYYEDGQIWTDGKYYDGAKIGEWKWYYENGKLKRYSQYDSEGYAKDGFKRYYESGQISELGQYDVQDDETGEWKEYYENGKLKAFGKYESGCKIGDWKYYHENGGIYQICLMAKGWLMEISSCFDENNNSLDKGTLVEGNGIAKEYHKNGELKASGEYKNGVKTGKWKSYHENGEIYQICLMTNGKFMEIYSCFDGNNNPLDKGTLVEGYGTVKEYNIKGELIKEVNYICGLRVVYRR